MAGKIATREGLARRVKRYVEKGGGPLEENQGRPLVALLCRNLDDPEAKQALWKASHEGLSHGDMDAALAASMLALHGAYAAGDLAVDKYAAGVSKAVEVARRVSDSRAIREIARAPGTLVIRHEGWRETVAQRDAAQVEWLRARGFNEAADQLEAEGLDDGVIDVEALAVDPDAVGLGDEVPVE